MRGSSPRSGGRCAGCPDARGRRIEGQTISGYAFQQASIDWPASRARESVRAIDGEGPDTEHSSPWVREWTSCDGQVRGSPIDRRVASRRTAISHPVSTILV
ncbi:hypothetical protein BN903_114 [Halorubrum sp. AJ67]|nr:hypothetical protein BN903_114 [Halorubrum sp. AJ67]